MLKHILVVGFLTALTFEASAKDFESWKKAYAKRASKRGVPQKYAMEILSPIKLDHEVIKKDRNQIILSKKHDYQSFIKRWLRDGQRASLGKEMLKKHRKLLEQVEKKYGVEKEVIVALWGVETLYGKVMGDHNIITSMASLAFEGRRRSFYETQLNAALRLMYKGHVKFDDLKGSWAGATGHCQFMPSNIPVYGQDFNKDGKIDLWNTPADVFASIANLLKRGGWKKGKSIGSLAYNEKAPKLNYNRYRTKKQYTDLGFRDSRGGKFKSEKWKSRRAATIPMQGSPIVLRGTNYSPLLKWNNSSLFAAFNILMVEAFKE